MYPGLTCVVLLSHCAVLLSRSQFCSEGCRDMVVNGAVRTADSIRAADDIRKTEQALLGTLTHRAHSVESMTDSPLASYRPPLQTANQQNQPKLLFTSSAMS